MSQDPQTGVLRVNFDPALVRLLREVRYFLLLPDLPIEIPANALKVGRHFLQKMSPGLHAGVGLLTWLLAATHRILPHFPVLW